jgi:hypothetical protein
MAVLEKAQAADWAGDLRVLLGLVDSARTVRDCETLRDEVSTVLAAIEPVMPRRQGESRPQVVRSVSAAVVHLGRAGGPVPVVLGCRMAAGDLLDAVERLESMAAAS